jgi:hypothetical protein
MKKLEQYSGSIRNPKLHSSSRLDKKWDSFGLQIPNSQKNFRENGNKFFSPSVVGEALFSDFRWPTSDKCEADFEGLGRFRKGEILVYW